MSKHTHGPWKAYPCHREGYTIWAGTETDPICVIDSQDYEGRYGALMHEADAHLIAAAPELLEALKVMVRLYAGQIQNNGGYDIALELAREAIAKAKGEVIP